MAIDSDAEAKWLIDWISNRQPKSIIVTADSEFVESGLLDSFGVIELIAAAEARFGIRFTEDDFANPDFNSVRGFIEIARQHAARQ